MASGVTSQVSVSPNFQGQTIIITGANSGLGLEAARQVLAEGALRVVLAVRSITKGEEAKTLLVEDPKIKSANPDAKILVMQLDLDDFTSVIKFAQNVKQSLNELDILLLNGGVSIMNYQTSASGHERVTQVNYHANVVLSLELLPLLIATATKKGKPSRLTFVGSSNMSLHTLSKNPLEENESIAEHFDNKEKYNGLQRYGDTKLLLYAWSMALAQHVSSAKVVINNVCPGLVATGFDANLPFWLKPIMWVVRKLLAKPVEKGGKELIYAAAVAGGESHGKFVFGFGLKAAPPIFDEPVGKQLVEKCWAGGIEEAEKANPKFKLDGIIA
ncbi:hypothetical protein MMC10_002254 [Thelotrema lepadinum]|nr:hypothetical protein [Thelotrema lepadinum]